MSVDAVAVNCPWSANLTVEYNIACQSDAQIVLKDWSPPFCTSRHPEVIQGVCTPGLHKSRALFHRGNKRLLLTHAGTQLVWRVAGSCLICEHETWFFFSFGCSCARTGGRSCAAGPRQWMLINLSPACMCGDVEGSNKKSVSLFALRPGCSCISAGLSLQCCIILNLKKKTKYRLLSCQRSERWGLMSLFCWSQQINWSVD